MSQWRGDTRQSAVFWVSQAAGDAATRGLDSLVSDEKGDRDIREHAVFALSQRPKEEGVPILIRIAKTNKDPEIRRRALFWLGQSEDPRALALFERCSHHALTEVVTKRLPRNTRKQAEHAEAFHCRFGSVGERHDSQFRRYPRIRVAFHWATNASAVGCFQLGATKSLTRKARNALSTRKGFMLFPSAAIGVLLRAPR